MRDIRHGEHLWFQWSGEGYYSDSDSDLIYCTIGHVDMDNEVVQRALASVLQRDGIVDSLGDGFKFLEDRPIQAGWAGFLPGEKDYIYCDESGETEYGDIAENPEEFTWIEF